MIEQIIKNKLIPVAVIDKSKDALPLAESLLAADINVIEVTLRTPAALESIRLISKEFPDMLLGAGTVLDHQLIPELIASGVCFAITPGLNPHVVESAQKNSLLVMPGVVTPSEIEQARNYDLEVLKFFPAEAAGGAAMLKAFAGPYAHTGIRFIPTGGVNLSNLEEYIKIPCVAAVGGTWFVSTSMINEGKFSEITRLSREALQHIRTMGT